MYIPVVLQLTFLPYRLPSIPSNIATRNATDIKLANLQLNEGH